MLEVFQSVINFFKIKRFCLDNNIFRLHYKFTTGVLVLFSVVVSAYQFFGSPVSCLKADVRQDVIETFCWAHSTYSLPEAFDKEYGEEVPYPGVATHVKGKTTKVYHQYYQWVCFMLMLQAILFCIPHYLWKTWEGGIMKEIMLNLDETLLDKDTKEENKTRLVGYLKDHLKLHQRYVTAYVLCEVLNFVNVVGQIFLIDKFLGNSFTKYGTKILEYTESDLRKRPDAMTYLFPKMTKCTFHVFGSGGSVEKIDVLCILPLNVINEKIYVFIWFWFIILATATAILLVYRISTLTSAQVRYIAILFRCTRVDRNDLQSLVSCFNVGDWFVLNLLAKNLDSTHFKELISALSEELKKEKADRLLYIHNGDKAKGFNL